MGLGRIGAAGTVIGRSREMPSNSEEDDLRGRATGFVGSCSGEESGTVAIRESDEAVALPLPLILLLAAVSTIRSTSSTTSSLSYSKTMDFWFRGEGGRVGRDISDISDGAGALPFPFPVSMLFVIASTFLAFHDSVGSTSSTKSPSSSSQAALLERAGDTVSPRVAANIRCSRSEGRGFLPRLSRSR